ncbi:MAG: methyltransferase domain-containing protein [Pseudomonadota bacterium]
MFQVDACLCCSSDDMRKYPAVVTPFIREYVLSNDNPVCNLLECKKCGFRFFDQRFEEDEVGKLYSRYRTDHYFQARNKHEFWYTRKINDSIGKDAGTITQRQAYLTTFLRNHIGDGKLSSVLDYGGDRGQFIPEDVAEERFVYEVSNAVPIPGVQNISSEKELDGRRYQLIMLCHVLEHLSRPSTLVTAAKKLLEDKNAYLLVEVPYEKYNLKCYSSSSLYQKFVRVISNTPSFIRKMNEMYTLFFRGKLNMIPPLGILRMHEHINFFDVESLSALLRNSGFKIIGHDLMKIKTDVSLTKVLLMLAQPAPKENVI